MDSYGEGSSLFFDIFSRSIVHNTEAVCVHIFSTFHSFVFELATWGIYLPAEICERTFDMLTERSWCTSIIDMRTRCSTVCPHFRSSPAMVGYDPFRPIASRGLQSKLAAMLLQYQ